MIGQDIGQDFAQNDFAQNDFAQNGIGQNVPGPVVFVLKGYPRLSETFIAQEIRGLERAGLPIRIVALRRPTDTHLHPIHREIEAPVSYLPEYLHEEPLRVLRGLFACLAKPGLWPALRAFAADLPRDMSRNRVRRFGQALVLAAELPGGTAALHAHFIHTPASVTRYTSLISSLSWTASAHAKDIWTSPGWELAEKLAHADWTVTCTASGKTKLDAHAPRHKPVHLLYHGFDRQRFPPLRLPRPRHDGSNPEQSVKLLTVGRAVEKKGFDLLLLALAKLPAHLHWQLTHIGGGDNLGALKSQAEALGLQSRIDWRGAQPQGEVLAAYKDADAFVLPCRIAADGDRDGLPNVIVEAQSQALPVLSTAVSAIPELVEDGRTGLLVPPDDAEALAVALERLIVEPDLRLSLGKAGALKVHAAFGHEDGIAALMALFGRMPVSSDAPLVANAAE